MKLRGIVLLMCFGMVATLKAQMMPFWGEQKTYPVPAAVACLYRMRAAVRADLGPAPRKEGRRDHGRGL